MTDQTELTDEQVVRVLATYEGYDDIYPLGIGIGIRIRNPPPQLWAHPPGTSKRVRTKTPDYFGSLDVMRRVECQISKEPDLFDEYIEEIRNTDFDDCGGAFLSAKALSRCAARVLVEAGVVKLEETT